MKKNRKISIGQLVGLVAVFTFIVLAAVVAYMSHMADTSLKNQASQVNQATLSYHRDKIDRALEELDRYLYNFIYGNNDVSLLRVGGSEQDLYLARTRISESLSQIVGMHSEAEGVFFYYEHAGETEFITRTSQVQSLSESKTLRDHIVTIVDGFAGNRPLDTSRWFGSDIQGKPYYLRLIYTNGAYAGAWVSAGHLAKTMEDIDFGPGSLTALCSPDGMTLDSKDFGVPLSLDHATWQIYRVLGEEFLQISAPSAQCDFAYVALIPIALITAEWESGMQTVLLFGVMLLLIMLIAVLGSNLIYRPFKVLVSAMRGVEKGELDIQIRKTSRLREFDHVYTIFNSMVSETKNLKIYIYEQKISEQKIMRQYLQMQLKSHFFLNCLNILYSLAQVREFELIQQMILCLTKHFRYMMRDASQPATIREEMEHIRNYVNIQELRFPEMLTYHQHIPEDVMEEHVPPLILQTFVENVIEHAINLEQHNDISLTIAREERENEKGLLIRIEDNGQGFSLEQLEKLNSDEAVTSVEYEKGIGINNIKNRLKLLYQDRARLHFQNLKPHCAAVMIWLPPNTEQEEKPKDLTNGEEETT